MALLGPRNEITHDITWFMNEAAERGIVVVASTAGSGAALDQSQSLVTCTITSGAVPVGLLLNDMVDKDLTTQKLNVNKNEVQKGSKVTLMTEGWVVTNKLTSGITVTNGQVAWLDQSGYLTNAQNASYSTAAFKVGRFLSTKNENGYAKVYIKLPNTL